MSGNVWEWTGDWYNRDYYADGPTDNPTGPSAGTPVQDGNTYRVLRSGNWYNGQWGHGRVSNRNPSYYRGPDDPNHSYYHIGFRPVRSAEGNAAARQCSPRLRPGRRSLGSPTRSCDRHCWKAPASILATESRAMTKSVPMVERLGLLINDTRAFNGYTLFAPKHNTMVYLIDNEGRVVNRWDTEYEPGQSVYLLENGHLLHCCFTKNGNFTRGGEGGRLEEYDWEGNLVWEFEYSTDKVLSHHDIAPLPNGNVLLLAVEYKSQEECIEAGFDPRHASRRTSLPRTYHRSEEDRSQVRRDRLEMARLGSPDPGLRPDESELRRCVRTSRVDRRSRFATWHPGVLESRQLDRLQREPRSDRPQCPRFQRDLGDRSRDDDGGSGGTCRGPALALGQPDRSPERTTSRTASSSNSMTPSGFRTTVPERAIC